MDNENSPARSEDGCEIWHSRSCSACNALDICNVEMTFEVGESAKTSTKLDIVKRPEIPTDRPLTITDLPPELLQQIFLKLSFDFVGKCRAVCQYFNTVASSLLNSEFSKLRMNMHQRFQSIKAQMPRRESARRKHPLARESDIIETLHMRLTLLHMTFGKHIERKHCCFFAGEILDEVYRILRYIKTTPTLNRAYKVTDELFDLSTMAMEYFKERIEPSLPEITYFTPDFLEYAPTIASASPKAHLAFLEEAAICSSSTSSKFSTEQSMSKTRISPAITKKLRKLRENMKKSNNQVIAVRRQLNFTKRKLLAQQKQIHDLRTRDEDYDKKFQSTSQKLNAVLQELSRCRNELQYWRSKSPAAQCACGKVTPVFDVHDIEYSSPDMQAGKISPMRSHDEPADDFKPISELEPVPSCSNFYRNFSSPPNSSKDKLVITCPFTGDFRDRKAVVEGRKEKQGSNQLEVSSKACKRKRDEDNDLQNMKRLAVQEYVDAYYPFCFSSSTEDSYSDISDEGEQNKRDRDCVQHKQEIGDDDDDNTVENASNCASDT